jgi:hypothetical protein
MVYGPNNNAVLVNGCNSLENLTVTLKVTVGLIAAGNTGFSLQLNCYPLSYSTNKGVPLEWAQYVLAVAKDTVWGQIQYWSYPKSHGFGGGTSPVQIGGGGTGPPNSVPQGTVMEIAVVTDPKLRNAVTKVTFSITFPSAKTISLPLTLPATALCAIYGFQVDVVAPPSGPPANFTSGAGNLTYAVSPSGTLAVAAVTPPCPNDHTGNFLVTSEQSNATYSAVSPPSGSTVSQNLFT